MRKLIPALLLPLVAGCLGLAKDYPDRHLHALGVDRPGEPASGPKGAILAIKPFTIAKRYEGSEFVYRKSETEWEGDYYNAFFVTPREMMTDAVRSWLGGAGIFENVTGMASAVAPTHILEGHVAQLWVDARTSPVKAVIELQILVADDRLSPAQIVFTKTYAETVVLKSDTPEEAVRGWDEGLKSALEKLEVDLRGVSTNR